MDHMKPDPTAQASNNMSPIHHHPTTTTTTTTTPQTISAVLGNADPMIDSGAHENVCNPSLAPHKGLAPRHGYELQGVDGSRLNIHGSRKVTHESKAMNGSTFAQEVDYTVADGIANPIRSVADCNDHGMEVHFGVQSWMAPMRKQLRPPPTRSF